MVEGFGGQKNAENMFDLLEVKNSSQVSLDAWLNTSEYDLIWVDYNDPFAAIEDNGGNLIAALEWINNRKHVDGSSEPNVLVGASMGGLVCQYALLEMHNVLNKDSEVEKFFSFDSPFKGANYPLGIQALIRDFVSLATFIGPSIPSVQQALSLLDSEAALQMIRTRAEMYSCGNGSVCFTTATSPDFIIFQNTISQLEAIKPLSGITKHIALSNGSDFGVLQESMTSILQIMHFYMKLDYVEPLEDLDMFYNVTISANVFAATDISTHLYDRTIEGTINIVGIDVFTNSTNFDLLEPRSLDIAPGSFSNVGLGQLSSSIPVIFELLESTLKESTFTFSMESFSFVPTVSSLNMPLETPLTISSPNGGMSVSRWTTSTDNSVVSPISGLPEFNQEHVSMNTRIVDVIVEELTPLVSSAAIQEIGSGEIYNFGRSEMPGTQLDVETPHHIAQDLTLSNGGELWINRNGRLFLNTDPANPFNGDPQIFQVSVPGTSCEEPPFVSVLVNSGSKIRIGEDDGAFQNIGSLRFGHNSRLQLHGQEALVIEENSSLTIENEATADLHSTTSMILKQDANLLVQNGSRITLHPNTNLVLEGQKARCVVRGNSRMEVNTGASLTMLGESNQLVIEKGGVLVLDPGSSIVLQNPTSKIRIEGTLVYNGDFDFQGQGYFEFARHNNFEFGPNATVFTLQGEGPTHRFINFDSDDLRIDGAHALHLSNGIITCSNGGINLRYGATGTFKNLEFQGGDTYAIEGDGSGDFSCENVKFISQGTGDLDGIFANVGFGMISLQNVVFDHTGQAVELEGRNDGLVAKNCAFIGGQKGLWMRNSAWAELKDCTFSGYGGTDNINYPCVSIQPWYNMAIELDNVNRLILRNSQVTNNDIGVYNGDLDSPAGIFLLECTQFSNNEIGIYMEGDEAYGLVLMDNSEMLDNDYGILGLDITLMLDGTNLQQHWLDGVSPNVFVRPEDWGAPETGYINVRHIQKSPYANNLLRKNFWGISSGNTIYPDNNPESFIKLSDVNCDPVVTPNVNPKSNMPPRPCFDYEFVSTGYPGGGADSECSVPSNGGTYPTINEQFHTAYHEFIEGNYDVAESLFEPVADLWTNDLSSYAKNCAQYIAVARAIVPGANAAMRPSANRAVNNQTLHITPNPANNFVTVQLPEGKWLVSLIDYTGVVVAEGQYDQYAVFDASAIAGGVYLVKAQSTESDRFLSEILLIAR